jgi:hypothetical protein
MQSAAVDARHSRYRASHSPRAGRPGPAFPGDEVEGPNRDSGIGDSRLGRSHESERGHGSPAFPARRGRLGREHGAWPATWGGFNFEARDPKRPRRGAWEGALLAGNLARLKPATCRSLSQVNAPGPARPTLAGPVGGPRRRWLHEPACSHICITPASVLLVRIMGSSPYWRSPVLCTLENESVHTGPQCALK